MVPIETHFQFGPSSNDQNLEYQVNVNLFYSRLLLYTFSID